MSYYAMYETTGRVSIWEADDDTFDLGSELLEVGYLGTDGADRAQVTSDLNRMLSGFVLLPSTDAVLPVSNGWHEYDDGSTWVRRVRPATRT